MPQAERPKQIDNPLLQQNVTRAAAALGRYLQGAPEQILLRTFQIDAVSAMRAELEAGRTAFHIKEATGVGKTAIALQVAESLMQELRFDDDTHTRAHGVAVFVSPTMDILTQTQAAAKKFAPDLRVTNFYSVGRDITGDVISTTYDSLPALQQALLQQARDIRLVICDEMHTGLGEVRHFAYRDMPNAIMVGLSATPDTKTLQRLIADKKVDASERWVGMFTDQAHEISLSEGLDRGILSPLIIWTVLTNIDASGIALQSTGEYTQYQVDAFVNQQGRSLMGVAMVAGEDAVHQAGYQTEFSNSDEIADIHHAIAGKKTLIHAGSVPHIKQLVKMLEDSGIPAIPFHGEMTKDERNDAIQAFKNSDASVMVGMKLLGLGLDLPEAEVGIYVVPTRSATILEQGLGRILRQAPGKDGAIAIQLLDQFPRGRAPILLPQILNPDLLAAANGLENE